MESAEVEVSDDGNSSVNSELCKKKPRKKGMIYLATIPPFMNVTMVTEIMSEFGTVGRVFLQPSAPKTGTVKKKKKAAHFTEGWVEFLSKRVAKEVARTLNNKQISNQKKSRYFDHIWNIKYLPRFKWIHLSERLEYERAVYKQRMRAEIAQAKREANHFAQNVEASERSQRKKKDITPGPIMQYKQRRTNDEILQSSESKTKKKQSRTDFLNDLFGNNSKTDKSKDNVNDCSSDGDNKSD